jgi:hypothetical protein
VPSAEDGRNPADCDTRLDDAAELTAYQRGAVVALALAGGERLRTRDVMQMTGLRRGGALKLMGHLAALRTAAVFFDDDGRWMIAR